MDEFKGDNDSGARLKSLREEMRASQREFGEALGFNQAAVSAFEQGKVVVRKPDALAVEYVYGVRHEWLLFGLEPKVRDSEELTEEDREVLRIPLSWYREKSLRVSAIRRTKGKLLDTAPILR